MNNDAMRIFSGAKTAHTYIGYVMAECNDCRAEINCHFRLSKRHPFGMFRNDGEIDERGKNPVASENLCYRFRKTFTDERALCIHPFVKLLDFSFQKMDPDGIS